MITAAVMNTVHEGKLMRECQTMVVNSIFRCDMVKRDAVIRFG